METTNIHFSSYLSQFFVKEEMFRTKAVEKIETHFVLYIFFFANLAMYEII
jgi:hypothetical protein